MKEEGNVETCIVLWRAAFFYLLQIRCTEILKTHKKAESTGFSTSVEFQSHSSFGQLLVPLHLRV